MKSLADHRGFKRWLQVSDKDCNKTKNGKYAPNLIAVQHWDHTSYHFTSLTTYSGFYKSSEERPRKASSLLREFTNPGASTSVRYSTYVENMTVLVTSNAKIDEVGWEIKWHEWNGISLPFRLALQNTRFIVWTRPPAGDELEVRENAEAAYRQWARRNRYLIRRAKVLLCKSTPSSFSGSTFTRTRISNKSFFESCLIAFQIRQGSAVTTLLKVI